MIEGEEMALARGTVKFFNTEKGFGFIRQERDPDAASEAPDVFFRFSAIEVPGYRLVEQGQPVEYEYVVSEQGLAATRVVPV